MRRIVACRSLARMRAGALAVALALTAIAPACPRCRRTRSAARRGRRHRVQRGDRQARSTAAPPCAASSASSASPPTACSVRRPSAPCRRFQRRNGLVVDGVVGPQTRGALGLEPFSQQLRCARSGRTVTRAADPEPDRRVRVGRQPARRLARAAATAASTSSRSRPGAPGRQRRPGRRARVEQDRSRSSSTASAAPHPGRTARRRAQCECAAAERAGARRPNTITPASVAAQVTARSE